MELDEFMGYQPTEITLFITGHCNFNCDFCGYKDLYTFKDIQKDSLTLLIKNLTDIITKDKNKKFYINLMGGEPTFNIDIMVDMMTEINKLKELFPDNIKTWLTSNGFFSISDYAMRIVESLNFDNIVLSCSEDHYNQGNYKFINTILSSGYKYHISYNMINYDKMYPIYLESLNNNEAFKDGEFYKSVNCINVKLKDLGEFLKDKTEEYDVLYKPFGIFILNDKIYTACAGEGTFPWCKLSDNINDLEVCLNNIKNTQLNVRHKCSNECMLTCRHLQESGYTCFDNKNLEITDEGKIIEKSI